MSDMHREQRFYPLPPFPACKRLDRLEMSAFPQPYGVLPKTHIRSSRAGPEFRFRQEILLLPACDSSLTICLRAGRAHGAVPKRGKDEPRSDARVDPDPEVVLYALAAPEAAGGEGLNLLGGSHAAAERRLESDHPAPTDPAHWIGKHVVALASSTADGGRCGLHIPGAGRTGCSQGDATQPYP